MQSSELILNSDGSIYHLGLCPSDIAETIILVGDPNRVPLVSRHFDSISVRKGCREFVTHTGVYRQKQLTVLSTGISTDNVDIAINELDALANIDLKSRRPKSSTTSLTLLRLGTSGAIRDDIEVDSLLLSAHAIGFDGLPIYYGAQEYIDRASGLCSRFALLGSLPCYSTSAAGDLLHLFGRYRSGVTLTMPGFYGPQGRQLRVGSQMKEVLRQISNEEYLDIPITNVEMETAGLYFLADLLGHQAISINAILANRSTGTFSEYPGTVIERMISECLDILVREGD